MMRCKVVVSARAKRQILRLPPGVDRRIEDAIDSLAENPRSDGAKKLQGAEDVYRIRVANCRLVYQVQDKALVVFVIKVTHRRDVYRRQ